jgi:hypothetical protein
MPLNKYNFLLWLIRLLLSCIKDASVLFVTMLLVLLPVFFNSRRAVSTEVKVGKQRNHCDHVEHHAITYPARKAAVIIKSEDSLYHVRNELNLQART